MYEGWNRRVPVIRTTKSYNTQLLETSKFDRAIMFARAVNDIIWSSDSYNTKDIMAKYPAPLLVRVTQGHCGLEDTDSLGQGQVVRIHRWLRQQRVIARDAGGRYLSIPLDFDVPFEVLGDRKRPLSKRKTMIIADIIRQFSLPKRVRFSPRHLTQSQALDGDRLGIRMTLEPLDLIQLHQEVYLNGNALNFGDLNPSVLSIPVHHDLELSLALGLASGNKNWQRLMRELDNVVAKRVRFGAVQGNKNITLYTFEENSGRSNRNTSTVQKGQQSLGRAFRYGTLQRNRAAGDEAKPRPNSVSVDLGSLARSGIPQNDVRGKERLFAKRKETRLKRAVDKVDAVSMSSTSTSAASETVSTTETLDDTRFWFQNLGSKMAGDDLDDDISDVMNDDDLADTYTPRSLFGSVSRLALFRPRMWSGRDSLDREENRRQTKHWNAAKSKRSRRPGSLSSLSMTDLRDVGVRQTMQRGPPDGVSVSGLDEIEQSTDL